MLGWYKSEKSELFHKARAFCAMSNGDKCISACRISEYGILAVISGKGDENYCVNINHSMQIPEEKLPSVLLGRAWWLRRQWSQPHRIIWLALALLFLASTDAACVWCYWKRPEAVLPCCHVRSNVCM